jgi:hypothetical protein
MQSYKEVLQKIWQKADFCEYYELIDEVEAERVRGCLEDTADSMDIQERDQLKLPLEFSSDLQGEIQKALQRVVNQRLKGLDDEVEGLKSLINVTLHGIKMEIAKQLTECFSGVMKGEGR